VSPEWQLCIGREVTKVFEEFRRGTAAELLVEMGDTDEARGEFTIVVAPPPRSADAAVEVDAPGDEQLDRLLRALLRQGVTPKTLASALAELPGASHKQAYAHVLAIARRT
jgi:16S rRNA (cytidine1402-2'-O)-methyltransferase